MEIDMNLVAPLVPVVVGTVSLIRKSWPWLKARTHLLPWCSIAVGLAVTGAWLLYRPPTTDVGQWLGYWLIHGAVAGGLASGAYSAVVSPVADAVISRRDK